MKASIWFIFITVVLDMIGIGLIIPALPDIMKRFTQEPSEISSYFGYFISLYAFMQFLASPLLGMLSDIWGRRPILLNSLFIGGLDYLLMAFAPTILILFIGRIVSGLMGANITVAFAYIADISDEKNRASNFGLIGAAFGLGFILGPALGGILGDWGSEYPFIAAAILNIVNFIFGYFILPESLPTNRRKKFDLSQMNPFKSLARILADKKMLWLMGLIFLAQLAGQTHVSTWTLYTKLKFDWDVAEVGASLALVGVLSAFTQGVLTRLITPKLGEYRTVKISFLGNAIAFFLYAFADQGWMMYAILIVSSVFWIANPALQSIVTAQSSDETKGEIQGGIVSLTSLAAILNPLICTQLFSYYSAPGHSYFPGAPYLFAAIICFIGWMLFLSKIRF